MTLQRRSPGREEVDEMARLLTSQGDQTSKRAMRHYMAGKTTWDFTIPLIRVEVSRLLGNMGLRVSHPARQRLLQFAADYGVSLRQPKADVPMSVRKNLRFTGDQWDLIELAAKNAGMTPTDWARMVVVAEARRLGEGAA